ncbi:MAG: peptidoglycan bridge formation glycyltransferase FemA/FemB family protein, partial [Spirochaetales bacterium]|nr:peptidoglycan bridge formation glycyltransferase FemA/FemB family protein [Spirochaetales bacterium]
RAVDRVALATLPEWYRLYRETARRDRITIHPEQYYRDVIGTAVAMREAGESAPSVTIYSAYHEDDLLVGIVVVSWGGMSTYLYGASSDRKRNLMASYLVQWEAMRAARIAGDATYDLFGIPPSDDPGHPMHGLYRFKTGFGGRVVHRPGCWDLSPSPFRSSLFRAAERARVWYHHGFRKRVRGA